MMKKSVGFFLALLLVLCVGATVATATEPEHTVTLTVTPDTDLLYNETVTYTVTAIGATHVKLVFNDDEYSQELTDPDQDGIWTFSFSHIEVDLTVRAEASFDNETTWISSASQTLHFEMLGRATFKATPDSSLVGIGDPVIIRFSDLHEMVGDISNPTIYKDGSDYPYSGSPTVKMNMNQLTCEITGLEKGTYQIEFWSWPEEIGYCESRALVEVTVAEKFAAAPTIKAYVFMSGEEVLPENGVAWYGCNIWWDLDAAGADSFEWTVSNHTIYSVDSTFNPNSNTTPDGENLIIPIMEYRTGHAKVFTDAGPWQDVGKYTFKARARSAGKAWSDWTEMHFELKCKGDLAAPKLTVNDGKEIHLGDDLTVVVSAVENAESYFVQLILEKDPYYIEFSGNGGPGTWTLSGDKVPSAGKYTVYAQVYTDGYRWNYTEKEITVLERVTPPADPEPPANPELPTGPYTDPNGTGSYNINSNGTATYRKPSGSKATVTIPDAININGQSVKVTAIADKAFQKNKKLTTITIGKNVKTIGKNAFNGATKLKTVKGGKGVVTIKDSAFNGCAALKTFPALSKLETIGANAFKGCKKLTKFTLDKKVKSIGKNAFNGCVTLKTITVKTEKLTDKNVKAGAFKGIHKKATFKCPKKKLKDYTKLFVKKGAPKTCKFS